jgi:3-hydroxymyristoyl/3-hydroxydecanoyl-(acyl carrier protein) dehydratase
MIRFVATRKYRTFTDRTPCTLLVNVRILNACARALTCRTDEWKSIRNVDVDLAVARLKGFGHQVFVSDVAGNERSATGVLRVRQSQLKELRGHFPGHPVLPAVLMLESMFQIAAARLARDATVIDICRVCEAHFRRPVTVGEDVRIRVDLVGTDQSMGRSLLRFQGQAHLLADDETMFGSHVADAVFESTLTIP